MVEAAGVEPRNTPHPQHLGRKALAQDRQNRSKRLVQVHIRYTEFRPAMQPLSRRVTRCGACHCSSTDQSQRQFSARRHWASCGGQQRSSRSSPRPPTSPAFWSGWAGLVPSSPRVPQPSRACRSRINARSRRLSGVSNRITASTELKLVFAASREGRRSPRATAFISARSARRL